VKDTEAGKRHTSEVTLALLVAGFGLIGVLAGGLITYFTNRELQEREITRQEQLELRAAKSAAAMESNRLSAVAFELDGIVRSRHVEALTPITRESRLGTAELAVMLAHLDAKRSRVYAYAEWCVGDATATIQELLEEKSSSLSAERVSLLTSQKKCIEDGERAVRTLGHA
jgi:hypothetical protein